MCNILFTKNSACSVVGIVGYEPAGLTMHPPPPKTIDGGFISFEMVSSATNFFPKRQNGFCRTY